MQTKVKPQHISFAAGIALLSGFFFAPAEAAQDQSPWAESFRSKVRLVAAQKRKLDGKSVLIAGLQVQLDKSWKTYWRSPGDAGLPPSFDWSKSGNVRSVQVLWPAPARFADPYGSSIGYVGEVVFPIAVEPRDPAKPVDFVLTFNFAVCKDICAPADAKLKLELGPGKTPHEALLTGYLDRVPEKLVPGAPGPSLAGVDFDLNQPRPHITVDAVFPGDAAKADLFVDGAPPLYIPLTKRVSEKPGGAVRFTVDLTKGDDPKELKGKILTFTLVSPEGNRETTRTVP